MLWIEKRRKISRTERGQLAPAGVGGDVGRRERAVPTIDLRARWLAASVAVELLKSVPLRKLYNIIIEKK
jgi:hypothetical protein